MCRGENVPVISADVVGKACHGRERGIDAARVPAQDIQCAVAESVGDVLPGIPHIPSTAASGTTGLNDDRSFALPAG